MLQIHHFAEPYCKDSSFLSGIVGLFSNQVMVQQPGQFIVKNFLCEQNCSKREELDNQEVPLYYELYTRLVNRICWSYKSFV